MVVAVLIGILAGPLMPFESEFACLFASRQCACGCRHCFSQHPEPSFNFSFRFKCQKIEFQCRV